MGQGCGPKGCNSSPFQWPAVDCSPSPIKGFEAGFERPAGGAFEAGPGTVCLDCSPRPIKGLEAVFERPAGGAFADGPGTVCLGVLVEVDKAKSSPSSSSMRESSETKEEEVEVGGDVENIPPTIVLHSCSMFECKEIENLEGDSLTKRYGAFGLSFLYQPFFILFFGSKSFNEGSL